MNGDCVYLYETPLGKCVILRYCMYAFESVKLYQSYNIINEYIYIYVCFVSSSVKKVQLFQWLRICELNRIV